MLNELNNRTVKLKLRCQSRSGRRSQPLEAGPATINGSDLSVLPISVAALCKYWNIRVLYASTKGTRLTMMTVAVGSNVEEKEREKWKRSASVEVEMCTRLKYARERESVCAGKIKRF